MKKLFRKVIVYLLVFLVTFTSIGVCRSSERAEAGMTLSGGHPFSTVHNEFIKEYYNCFTEDWEYELLALFAWLGINSADDFSADFFCKKKGISYEQCYQVIDSLVYFYQNGGQGFLGENFKKYCYDIGENGKWVQYFYAVVLNCTYENDLAHFLDYIDDYERENYNGWEPTTEALNWIAENYWSDDYVAPFPSERQMINAHGLSDFVNNNAWCSTILGGKLTFENDLDVFNWLRSRTNFFEMPYTPSDFKKRGKSYKPKTYYVYYEKGAGEYGGNWVRAAEADTDPYDIDKVCWPAASKAQYQLIVTTDKDSARSCLRGHNKALLFGGNKRDYIYEQAWDMGKDKPNDVFGWLDRLKIHVATLDFSVTSFYDEALAWAKDRGVELKNTPKKTTTPTPTKAPTATPVPTTTDVPTPGPTAEPTKEPEPTKAVEPTPTVAVTATPTAEATPEVTPELTAEPTVTDEPEPTAVEPTVTPEVTDEPVATPEVTDEPETTPEPTAVVEATPTVIPTSEPKVTQQPTAAAVPDKAETPAPAEDSDDYATLKLIAIIIVAACVIIGGLAVVVVNRRKK